VLYGNDDRISGRADSTVCVPYKEKRTLPGTRADVSRFVCVAALDTPEGVPMSVLGFGNINPIPFRQVRVEYTNKITPFRNGILLSLRID